MAVHKEGLTTITALFTDNVLRGITSRRWIGWLAIYGRLYFKHIETAEHILCDWLTIVHYKYRYLEQAHLKLAEVPEDSAKVWKSLGTKRLRVFPIVLIDRSEERLPNETHQLYNLIFTLIKVLSIWLLYAFITRSCYSNLRHTCIIK